MEPTAKTPRTLERLFDYAGLFPPAQLTMTDAVRNFVAYRQGAHRHLLNAFVVPATRLQEFTDAISPFEDIGTAEDKIQLSILSSNWAADLPCIQQFQAAERVDIVSVETRSLLDSDAILETVDRVYVELPVGPDLANQIAQLQHTSVAAKIRTGGLTEDAFPSCEDVADFISNCCRRNVSFKATAGLHHPVRSLHPTTSEPDAPNAIMHGFLNVIAAVSAAMEGASRAEVATILANSDYAKENDYAAEESRNIKARKLFHSIGSCSFEEPVSDLNDLCWFQRSARLP